MGQSQTSHHYRPLTKYLLLWLGAALLAGSAASAFSAQPRVAPGLTRAGPAVNQTAAPRARRIPALDRRIDKILSSSEARRGDWGIEVVELPSGKPLYQRDADRLFIPPPT